MKEKRREKSTYERLLQSAGQIFAERGFKAATIRDICQHADANVAAVNYHFGDKLKLIEAILNQVEQTWHARIPEVRAQMDKVDSDQEKLKIFIRNVFMWGLKRPEWHAKLMHRIFHTTDESLHELFRPLMDKRFGVVCDIVRGLMGNKAAEEDVRMCSFSLISQFVFFFHRPVPIKKGKLHLDPRNSNDLEKIINHIAKFSLAGMITYGK